MQQPPAVEDVPTVGIQSHGIADMQGQVGHPFGMTGRPVGLGIDRPGQGDQGPPAQAVQVPDQVGVGERHGILVGQLTGLAGILLGKILVRSESQGHDTGQLLVVTDGHEEEGLQPLLPQRLQERIAGRPVLYPEDLGHLTEFLEQPRGGGTLLVQPAHPVHPLASIGPGPGPGFVGEESDREGFTRDDGQRLIEDRVQDTLFVE